MAKDKEKKVKECGSKAAKETESTSDKEVNELKAQLEAVQKELEATREELAKTKDSFLRTYADLENVRRRAAQDRLDLISSASKDVISGILGVLDSCDAALRMLEEGSPERTGVETICNNLLDYLKTKGLEKIEAKGEVFDTEKHEAVAQFPVSDEDMKGKVFDVTQTGYILAGKVLRYAKVVVGI
ncbi:MAG: nucleotide exchange factor GrpE [Bacteroidales bacterium]|nr:nucleotide exchange factor GrpE [Bacteroidales bacterium]